MSLNLLDSRKSRALLVERTGFRLSEPGGRLARRQNYSECFTSWGQSVNFKKYGMRTLRLLLTESQRFIRRRVKIGGGDRNRSDE
jgi:hypothetical protein